MISLRPSYPLAIHVVAGCAKHPAEATAAPHTPPPSALARLVDGNVVLVAAIDDLAAGAVTFGPPYDPPCNHH
jgi:hypothetical protein